MPLIDVAPADFANEGLQYMVGRSPVLFDFLTSLPGLLFSDCWESRTTDDEECQLGCVALIAAKSLAGRPQDLQDLSEIKRARMGAGSGNPS
jgi:hypothetical protein